MNTLAELWDGKPDKELKTTVSNKICREVKDEAEKLHLSTSAFLRKIIERHIKDSKTTSSEANTLKKEKLENVLKIKVSYRTYQKVLSDKGNLSISEYLRKIIERHIEDSKTTSSEANTKNDED